MVAVGRQNELAEPEALTQDLSSVKGVFGSSGEMPIGTGSGILTLVRIA